MFLWNTMTSYSQENAPIRPTAFGRAATDKTLILLVDDNLAFLELYSQILRDAGYEVLTASKGRQALRIIRDRLPNLVVLDVVMPDMSGIEVCRRIKGDAVLRDVFVVLISGHATSAEQTVDGLAIGADEYLFKPVGPSEFLARIRTMVRLMETTAALRASEQHYRRLVEILPDAVALIDPQFRLAGLNRRAAVMLGYAESGELLGKNIFDLIQTKDRDRFRADIAALKTVAVGSAEYVLLKQNGQCIPVEMSAALSAAPSGEWRGLITVARDITDRKRVEEELRHLPRRITEAQEAERSRVARELHDGVNQVIASAAMRLRRVQDTLSAQNPSASELLSRCHKLLVQALEENRRIAHNLRPSDLDELGLNVACRNLCKELQTRTGLVVRCQLTRFERPLPPQVDLGLFRIVQEALNNVEKHAEAKMVRLRIAIQRETVMLKIQDDGRGFDAATPEAAKGERRGIGLSSLRERATALGGTCEVISNRRQGTAITVRVPFPIGRRGKAGR
jgi:PAS domain S-box-containing protein